MSDRHPCNPEYSDTPTFYQVSEYSDKFRTDCISAEDWLGHRFSVGETVMYCIGAGRGQLMAYGVIKQIRTTPGRHYNWETRDYDLVEDIEVQVLTSKSSGDWDNDKRTRPAWVNPLNITALPEGFIQ